MEHLEAGYTLGPRLVAAKHDELRGQCLHLLECLRHAGLGRGALHVHIEPVGPRRRRLRPGLECGEVHSARAEGEQRVRKHAGTMVKRDDERGLVRPRAGGGHGRARAAEHQESRLVGGIVFDTLREWHQAMCRRRGERRDRGLGRITVCRHHFGAPCGVPCADQLGIGQVLREPAPALPKGHRMRVDPLDILHTRAGHRHDRVVNREQRFVGQLQLAVAEGLVQQVVRGGHRTDQGILDRQAASISSSIPNGCHGVGHFTAGYGFKLGPAPPRRGFAEGAISTLNRYAHLGHAPVGDTWVSATNEKRPADAAGGASRVRSGRATARYRNRTQLEPRRRW